MTNLDEASSLADIRHISDSYITSLKGDIWTELDNFVPLISVLRILLILFLELDCCSLRSSMLPETFVNNGLAAAHLNLAVFVCVNDSSDKDILLLNISENIADKLVRNLAHLKEAVSLGVDLYSHAFAFDTVDIAYRDQVSPLAVLFAGVLKERVLVVRKISHINLLSDTVLRLHEGS